MAQQTDNSDSHTWLQLRCDPEFKENVRIAAAQSGKSMSEFVRDTLQRTWTGTGSEISISKKESDTTSPSGDFEGDESPQKSDNSGGTKA